MQEILSRNRIQSPEAYTKAKSTLLFSSPTSPNEPLKTYILTNTLARQATSTLGFPLTVKTYRQISIAVTEKHIRQIANPFNHYDDRSKEADVNVVFSWQSRHRPLQRGTTYGIDGAFPDSLQPALLRVYKWPSNEWHKFLQLQPANSNLPSKMERTQKLGVSSSVDCRPQKRRRAVDPPERIECPPLQDRHTSPKCREHEVGNHPWATATEVASYSTAPKFFWPGSVPIFGRPSPLERDSVVEERKMISTHINSEEAKVNSNFDSHHRLHTIDQAFVRWRNVGCQLCYARHQSWLCR